LASPDKENGSTRYIFIKWDIIKNEMKTKTNQTLIPLGKNRVAKLIYNIEFPSLIFLLNAL